MICASLDRKDCCEWLIEKRVNIADEDTSHHNAIWYANNANHPVLASWLQSRLNVDALCEGLPVHSFSDCGYSSCHLFSLKMRLSRMLRVHTVEGNSHI